MTTKFQGSGFAISLPDGALDASAYCFVLQNAGDMPPNFTIKTAQVSEPPDLVQMAAAHRETLAPHVPDFELKSEVSNQRGNWTYTINVIEWGTDDGRLVQKIFYIFVPGEKPCVYTLTCSDLAANFARSEPVFDQVIGTFDPNGVQLF